MPHFSTLFTKCFFFFFNDTATTEIYTLSLHDALPIPTAAEQAAYDRAQTVYEEASRALRQQIDALEAPHRERLFKEKLAALSEDAQLAHKTPKSQRTVEQENTVQETAGRVKVSEAELAKALSGADRTRRQSLQNDLKKIPKPPSLPATMALSNTNGVYPRTFILH